MESCGKGNQHVLYNNDNRYILCASNLIREAWNNVTYESLKSDLLELHFYTSKLL